MDPTVQAQVAGIPPKESNPNVFSSYVREAKVYDEAMVARWKVAMDGILLFAALFSAVVTAFIIESYKLLSPDPAALTLLILYQISQQLANGSQTIAFLPNPSQIPFSPSTPAVLTNIFWFLSLALSLTCALAATLIQQWASEYIHAIERRQVPEMRGRIRAFLFEGVESSRVSAIVEGTPALLHASLFSFLLGLVFFLRPMNNAVAYLMSALLFACGTVYFYATIAPLISIASPIRTPLTTFIFPFSFIRNTLRTTVGTSWKLSVAAAQTVSDFSKMLVRRCIFLLHQFGVMVDLLTSIAGRNSLSRYAFNNRNLVGEQQNNFWPKVSSLAHWFFPIFQSSADELLGSGNLDEIREKVALDNNRAGFQAREMRALTWTLDCLTTDIEFMQFIEGIPSYLENISTDQYEPSQIIAALLKHDDCIFARSHFPSLVYQSRPTERTVSAALDLISSLAGKSLFPYSLVHGEQEIWYGDVIPICHLFFRPEFSALSSVFDRTKFLTILHCSEDLITLDRPRLPEEYFVHVWQWIHGLADINSIPWSEGVNEFKRLISGLNPSPYPLRSLGMAELKTALACCTLIGLCDFVSKEMSRDRPDTESIVNLPIHRFVQLTLFLARGSPQQQQVYASAFLVTTSAFARHSEIVANVPSLQWTLAPLLQPLVYITDVDALHTIRETLSSRFWWEHDFLALDVIRILQSESSEILRDSAVASVYWVKGLFNLFSWQGPPEAIIASHLEQRPSGLAGLHSELQNDFVKYMSSFKIGNSTFHRQLAAALFSLAGTLDDAEAATKARKCFEEYIPQFDELYHDLDQTKKDQHFLDAKEALEKLQQKVNEPGFIYKALSLRLEE